MDIIHPEHLSRTAYKVLYVKGKVNTTAAKVMLAAYCLEKTHEGFTVNQLCYFLNRKYWTGSRWVNHLKNTGYIKVKHDRGKFGKLYVFTDKGREALKYMHKILKDDCQEECAYAKLKVVRPKLHTIPPYDASDLYFPVHKDFVSLSERKRISGYKD